MAATRLHRIENILSTIQHPPCLASPLRERCRQALMEGTLDEP